MSKDIETIKEVLEFVKNWGFNLGIDELDSTDSGYDKMKVYIDTNQALAEIKRIIEEAKPKDYPVCENNQNPDVSSWCNQCWTCSVRHNPELWDGIEIGIETFELNLLKALGE